MRKKDREFLIEEARKRLESMVLRFEQIRTAYPWLAPSMTYAEVRRTVTRLREGSFQSREPDIPSDQLVLPDRLFEEVGKIVRRDPRIAAQLAGTQARRHPA